MFWPLVMDEGIPRLVGYGLAFVTCNSLTFATQNASQCWICADPWLLNAPASAVIHLIFFLLIHCCWSVFLKICFWSVGFFDTLLNLVALNMYDSSHHASCRWSWHPLPYSPKYALHPYALYSIPGMLQQSGLALPSKITSKSVVNVLACFLKAIDSVIDFAMPSASSSGSEAGCELLQLQHRHQRRYLFLFCSEHCLLVKRAVSLVACFFEGEWLSLFGVNGRRGWCAKSCVRLGACLLIMWWVCDLTALSSVARPLAKSRKLKKTHSKSLRRLRFWRKIVWDSAKISNGFSLTSGSSPQGQRDGHGAASIWRNHAPPPWWRLQDVIKAAAHGPTKAGQDVWWEVRRDLDRRQASQAPSSRRKRAKGWGGER